MPDGSAAALPTDAPERAGYITSVTPTPLPPVPEGPAPGAAQTPDAAPAQLTTNEDTEA